MTLINVKKASTLTTAPTKGTSVGSGGGAAAKIVIPIAPTTMSLFNSNSNQYYKPHSLTVGVGSVRNSRHRKGKT